ncbi:sugar ABC transporter permease [Periweissella fabaria]|uniref:Diacetylchitobiose uptake system permease protein NgcF n=1 Tax=Periweissella fabaria TaxID=546157 RepID=A0ABN8BEV6_9LACO|nr:sugar ABC transporter permease [Periweissella fabaria]MCM0597232.1 sugar ABC transporter permease [Periweissella fabaria]CAH0416262.1 Diacetylchitobiose uptake system permease protein NgcF [Periweissella fabaria]
MEIKASKRQLLLFVVIPLLPLIVFWIIPLIVSLWLSFTDWNYISPTFNYVGIKNYTQLFTSQEFKQALAHTAYFTFFSVVPIIVLGFLLAVGLNKLKRSYKFIQALLFAPWVTPLIGMSIVWGWIFNSKVGPINQILHLLHLPEPQWLTNPTAAMWTIIIVTIWKNAGWAALFFSDALAKIPASLFEVSDMEGLSWWQKIWYVLIPLVSPTTLFLVIVMILECLQAYDQITVLTQGGPAGSTTTLLYLYYQLGFKQFQMGSATALSIIILVISAILAYISIRMSRKHTYY